MDDLFDKNHDFGAALHYATEAEAKELSDIELKLVMAMGMVTLKQFSELTDEQLKIAQTVLPKLKDIIKSTMHNCRLFSKEITVRALPMN